jgi:truncated hemoglobin YjbI
VYTPPALLLLMLPSIATACTSAGGKRVRNHHFGKKLTRGDRSRWNRRWRRS